MTQRLSYDTLTEAVRRHVRPGGTYVVGYSGGPDSTALLHVFMRLAEEVPVRVIAAHFNHHLRGAASDADAAACAEWCAARRVAYVCGEADVNAYARAQRLSLEDAARRCRFRWFCEVARANEATAVVLAHHADDQAETVLLRLLRGAGMRGIGGIRPITQFRGVTIIRPWLEIPRDVVHAYVVAHSLQVCVDHSNKDQRMDRNWVRHEILPRLASRYPDVVRRLCASAAIARDAEEYLAARAEELFRHFGVRSFLGWLFPLEAFAMLPPAVQRALVYHLLSLLVGEEPVPASFERIERLREYVTGSARSLGEPLPHPLFAEKAYGHLLMGVKPSPIHPHQLEVPGATTLFASMKMSIEEVSTRGEASSDNGEGWHEAVLGRPVCMVQYATLQPGMRVSVRARRPGEHYQPVHGPRHKIKDLLSAAHIPAVLRDSIPVVASDEGVVWLAGWRIADGYAVRAPGRIYRLSLLISAPENTTIRVAS
ncbi:MAG: tRNA lysidine(34) synthetase TilS [bacterium]|nr:tRNA lysidine(34) synthetase TilS [bacterium]